jgi:hypothetical protein
VGVFPPRLRGTGLETSSRVEAGKWVYIFILGGCHLNTSVCPARWALPCMCDSGQDLLCTSSASSTCFHLILDLHL